MRLSATLPGRRNKSSHYPSFLDISKLPSKVPRIPQPECPTNFPSPNAPRIFPARMPHEFSKPECPANFPCPNAPRIYPTRTRYPTNAYHRCLGSEGEGATNHLHCDYRPRRHSLDRSCNLSVCFTVTYCVMATFHLNGLSFAFPSSTNSPPFSFLWMGLARILHSIVLLTCLFIFFLIIFYVWIFHFSWLLYIFLPQ